MFIITIKMLLNLWMVGPADLSNTFGLLGPGGSSELDGSSSIGRLLDILNKMDRTENNVKWEAGSFNVKWGGRFV